MANTYASTVLQDARLWISENANLKFERNRDLSQILDVFFAGQSYIPDLENLKQATTQATSIMYPTKKDFTINSAKSCTPSGETGGSAVAALSWVQKGFAVKHQTKKYHGNEMSSVIGLAYDMQEAELAFWLGSSGNMESLALAFLETYRTQVNALSGSGGHNTWLGTPDFAVQVANADRSRFYNWLMAEMALNNFSGSMFDVCNTAWMADAANYAAQGTANSVNTAYQFDGFVRKYSNKIIPTGYNDSVHYIIPEGGVAILTWNELLNRQGIVDGEREWMVVESMFKPGVYFDVFIKKSCADTSADGGATQDRVIDYEFTLNYSFVKQPNSTANKSPIFKYEILSA